MTAEAGDDPAAAARRVLHEVTRAAAPRDSGGARPDWRRLAADRAHSGRLRLVARMDAENARTGLVGLTRAARARPAVAY